MKPKPWAVGLLAVTGVWSLAITLSRDVYQHGSQAVLGALVSKPMYTVQAIIEALPLWAVAGLAPGIVAGILYRLTRRYNLAMYTWTIAAFSLMAFLTYGWMRTDPGF